VSRLLTCSVIRLHRCLFLGLLRGAVVPKRAGSDDETHSSSSNLGSQGHLHSGIGAQGQ